MTTCEPGDVVLVPFPFADLETSKQRPALVLCRVTSNSLPDLIIVAMVTSRTHTEEMTGDCSVEAWAEAGLARESKVRLAKLVTLEQRLVRKRLGDLRAADRDRVGAVLASLLAAWLAPAGTAAVS